MIPPLPSPSETVEVANLGKRERCNTGGSSTSDGPATSLDHLFLHSGDVALDGGLCSLTSSAAGPRCLRSSDAVEELHASDAKPPSQEEREEEDGEVCPMVNLTAKLERIGTGGSIVPLNETFRMSSREWANDLSDPDFGPMHPTMFMGGDTNGASESSAPPKSTHDYDEYLKYQTPLANPPLSSDWVMVADHLNLPSSNENATANSSITPAHFPPPLTPLSPQSNPNIMQSLPPVASSSTITASATKSTTPPSSPATSCNKKKKAKRRHIDESCAVDPADGDVLFGRGGFTNNHPGNVRFRQRALELRQWYELPATSKEEKFRLSDVLVESVKCDGHRFLERGEDGLWHEVIGNGARKKASQALREHVRGTRRAERGQRASGIAGTKAPVSRAEGGLSVEELIGDLQPATVTGDEIGI